MVTEETAGQRIKRLRETMKLTQKDLAAKLGVTMEQLNRWENDHHVPHKVFANKLDEIYQEWSNGTKPTENP